MHQIWTDKYTHKTVIKKDHSLPFDYANLFWFRANILEQGQSYCILLTQLCRKIDFLNLLCDVDPHFWLFGRKYRKNYRKPIYRHFSNYRQNYRYRYEISKFIGDFIIGKIIDIEINWRFIEKLSISIKNYLSTNPIGGWACGSDVVSNSGQ